MILVKYFNHMCMLFRKKNKKIPSALQIIQHAQKDSLYLMGMNLIFGFVEKLVRRYVSVELCYNGYHVC